MLFILHNKFSSELVYLHTRRLIKVKFYSFLNVPNINIIIRQCFKMYNQWPRFGQATPTLLFLNNYSILTDENETR